MTCAYCTRRMQPESVSHEVQRLVSEYVSPGPSRGPGRAVTAAALKPAAPAPRPAGRPVVVSIAGLAGAGKSSLCQALKRLDPEVRARPRISLWRYVAGIPPLIPTFLRLHRPFHGVLAKEMKRILRLHALERLVHETTDCRILVFDEGPVYLLARILVYGGPGIKTRSFQECWRRAIATWAVELNAIVWLDAPEDLLAARLRARPVHPFAHTGTDDRSVRGLLRAYRAAFDQVIGELTAAGGPLPWALRTDLASVDWTARDLLVKLRRLGGAA